MSKIWIIDDDQGIRWVLDKALQRVHLQATTFDTVDSLLTALKTSQPHVLVTDIRMPDMSGLELLKKIKHDYPDIVVIVMTAFTDLDSTVEAFQGGAFDYLPKPFDINDAVSLIQRACEHSQMLNLNKKSMAESADIPAPSSADVGKMMTQSHSKSMQEIFRAIGRLAPSKVTVLITGESGSGKELIARAVHEHGNRKNKPFVAINAAAIPKDLLEAELFGHEKGAFTGANQLRKGRFEEADGGTLFLDEIGDMPLDLQTRLLRVLAEGSFYRIGGTQPVHVDVRIIAATHQPLEDRVEQGVFREDLFHRLNVIRLRIPPLRERKDDIPQLARHFLRLSAASLAVPVKQLSNEVLEALCQFDFPGNVRQLENFCHWLTVMSPASLITMDDLPPELLASLSAKVEMGSTTKGSQLTHQTQPLSYEQGSHSVSPYNNVGKADITIAEQGGIQHFPSDWEELLRLEVQKRLNSDEQSIMDNLNKIFEKAVIETALHYYRGRKIDTANRLGIGRNTVTRKLKELDLEA
ncbi:chemotaxis protein CheY [Pelistega indica]|uniref:DNA-binding transcriptional regulator NtrC n=1 Tax=Pelistega indica TaxID=1414851 RepID=V8G7S2_9BURK|nr:nitrogen regulation protein NR(I) [Pelistega indica]ETD72450.1 chemotaxis protein CheY [Pelistega indica]